ncbi:unnamed protein product [Ambrosiozyma monospora]|uniref:Unnamed protein product n=1 Tax=Ambrosiozyma monospora TaxID=43982 RepID=A0A9W7DFP6_AMBMO|nr:unnamed protein product [Ambrosiozyma monospora]
MDDPVITLQRDGVSGFSLDDNGNGNGNADGNGGCAPACSRSTSSSSSCSNRSFDQIPILIVNREEAENLRQVHLSKVREASLSHSQQVQ